MEIKKQTTYRIIYLLDFNKILSFLIMYAKEKKPNKTTPHNKIASLLSTSVFLKFFLLVAFLFISNFSY